VSPRSLVAELRRFCGMLRNDKPLVAPLPTDVFISLATFV